MGKSKLHGAVVSIAAITVLSGCAAGTPHRNEAEKVPQGRLYGFQHKSDSRNTPVRIVSADSYLGRTCKTRVRIDHRTAGVMAPHEAMRVWVKPGKHVVSAGPDSVLCGFNSTEKHVDLSGDRGVTLRIFFDHASNKNGGRTLKIRKIRR
jgi:hypothetical protein